MLTACQKAKEDAEDRQTHAADRVAERYRQLDEEKAAKRIVFVDKVATSGKKRGWGASRGGTTSSESVGRPTYISRILYSLLTRSIDQHPRLPGLPPSPRRALTPSAPALPSPTRQASRCNGPSDPNHNPGRMSCTRTPLCRRHQMVLYHTHRHGYRPHSSGLLRWSRHRAKGARLPRHPLFLGRIPLRPPLKSELRSLLTSQNPLPPPSLARTPRHHDSVSPKIDRLSKTTGNLKWRTSLFRGSKRPRRWIFSVPKSKTLRNKQWMRRER